ncbi:MAG TPA: hypothetical protein VMN77_01335 [Nitrospiria bacterium]|jgi:hypothetical protein|nr:hypothetical protein [Nitrospiria bacterium]
MLKPVPDHHPLRQLFTDLTERTFSQQLRWPDQPVAHYVSNLLLDFIHVDHLYRIGDIKGKRLEEVAGMLLEADLLLNAGSVEREREVHRHIGDFTLFMVGLFPEFLNRIKIRQWIHHPDFLIDYVKVGKCSYRNVSEFNYGKYKPFAPLFRKLSDNFELCVIGLGYIKAALDHLQNAEFQQAKKILLN